MAGHITKVLVTRVVGCTTDAKLKIHLTLEWKGSMLPRVGEFVSTGSGDLAISSVEWLCRGTLCIVALEYLASPSINRVIHRAQSNGWFVSEPLDPQTRTTFVPVGRRRDAPA